MMKKELERLLKGLTIKEESTYECPICKDNGYYIKDGVAIPCICQDQKRSKLPKKLEGVYLKDFKLTIYPDNVIDGTQSGDTHYTRAEELKKAGKKFLKKLEAGEGVRGFYIKGNVGSGKTFFVSCIANEAIRLGKDVTFLVVPEFLDQVKEEMFSDEKKEKIFLKAKKAPILVLDDLGAHNYTPFIINQLYTLLNYRLNNLLPTFITTNLGLDEVEDYLGERISSRIMELCVGFTLVSDTDLRSK